MGENRRSSTGSQQKPCFRDEFRSEGESATVSEVSVNSNQPRGRNAGSEASTSSVKELDPGADNFLRFLSASQRRVCTLGGRNSQSHLACRHRNNADSDPATSSPLSSDSLSMEMEMLSTPQGRREWTQKQVHERKSEYVIPLDVQIFTGTWNVCGAKPAAELQNWLFADGRGSDIYAIGLQEVQPLSGISAMATDPARGKSWTDFIGKTLAAEGDYVCLSSRQMVGILLLVYVRRKHLEDVQDIMITEAGTGFLNKGGNKGAVAMRFQLHETSFCFVACHLAAQQNNTARRNQDFREVMRKTTFTDEAEYTSLTNMLHSAQRSHKIIEHDLIVWFGDLNYRIDLSSADVLEAIKAEDWDRLIACDQLHMARSLEPDLFQGFKEADLNFAPTYKMNSDKEGYVLGENGVPSRPPSWTDRILWKTTDNNTVGKPSLGRDELCFDVKCLSYRRHEVLTSDHRPVSARFRARILQVNGDSRSRVISDIHSQLLPDVEISPEQLWFERLYLNAESSGSFAVKNMGKVPVEFDIRAVPSWMEVVPTSGTVPAGDAAFLRVTIRMDRKMDARMRAEKWTSDACETLPLEGAFKLAVQDGPTLELPVVSSYLCCGLGASLEALCTSSVDPQVEVPLCISMLCDGIATSASAFTNPGSQRGLSNIFEAVSNAETLSTEEAGGVFSECLLHYLRCLDKPLVAADCFDAFAYAGTSMQQEVIGSAMSLLAQPNRSTLEYILASLRKANLSDETQLHAYPALAEVVFDLPRELMKASLDEDLGRLALALQHWKGV
mmetsp:Transcript_9700/g.29490  ORF Transcript_9700/g.29490 Transcript_9700/m.29490 type:complete len:784 (+) Transcript_9700:1152-3503(+)